MGPAALRGSRVTATTGSARTSEQQSRRAGPTCPLGARVHAEGDRRRRKPGGSGRAVPHGLFEVSRAGLCLPVNGGRSGGRTARRVDHQTGGSGVGFRGLVGATEQPVAILPRKARAGGTATMRWTDAAGREKGGHAAPRGNRARALGSSRHHRTRPNAEALMGPAAPEHHRYAPQKDVRQASAIAGLESHYRRRSFGTFVALTCRHEWSWARSPARNRRLGRHCPWSGVLAQSDSSGQARQA